MTWIERIVDTLSKQKPINRANVVLAAAAVGMSNEEFMQLVNALKEKGIW